MELKELAWDNYVTLDFETTGLDPEMDSIIEVGLLFVFDGEPAKPVSWVINPNYPDAYNVPEKIVDITGITSAEVGVGADPAVFYPSMIRLLGGVPIWGHNSSQFDKKFLEYECSRLCIIPPSDDRWFDTAALFKASKLKIIDELEYYSTFQQFADYVLDKRVKGLYYNLPYVCEELGVYTGDITGWHRAGADIIGTMRIVEKFKEILF